MKKHFLLLILPLLTSLSLTGCGKNKGNTTEQTATVTDATVTEATAEETVKEILWEETVFTKVKPQDSEMSDQTLFIRAYSDEGYYISASNPFPFGLQEFNLNFASKTQDKDGNEVYCFAVAESGDVIYITENKTTKAYILSYEGNNTFYGLTNTTHLLAYEETEDGVEEALAKTDTSDVEDTLLTDGNNVITSTTSVASNKPSSNKPNSTKPSQSTTTPSQTSNQNTGGSGDNSPKTDSNTGTGDNNTVLSTTPSTTPNTTPSTTPSTNPKPSVSQTTESTPQSTECSHAWSKNKTDEKGIYKVCGKCGEVNYVHTHSIAYKEENTIEDIIISTVCKHCNGYGWSNAGLSDHKDKVYAELGYVPLEISGSEVLVGWNTVTEEFCSCGYTISKNITYTPNTAVYKGY